MRSILQDEPALPKGNVITHNLVLGGRWFDLFDYWAFDFHGLVEVRDNWVTSEGVVRRRAVPDDGWDPYYLNSTSDEGYRTWRRDEPATHEEFAGNRLTAESAGRFDPRTVTFTPSDPAWLGARGFEAIPTARIGLQRDAWRVTLPSRPE